ncbi:unnamed protein product [Meganyctiphanes norvegica]|uniref:Uncharacterized protein n=1 Tax=Meganyctiphanes norvegica TaxID=48144 RepID=A0AAV2SVM8_MEGNR
MNIYHLSYLICQIISSPNFALFLRNKDLPHSSNNLITKNDSITQRHHKIQHTHTTDKQNHPSGVPPRGRGFIQGENSIQVSFEHTIGVDIYPPNPSLSCLIISKPSTNSLLNLPKQHLSRTVVTVVLLL